MMKRWIAPPLLCAVLVGHVALAEEPAPVAEGQTIFQSQACHQCHAVSSAGIAKLGDPNLSAPDLAGIGQRHDADWVKGWLHGGETQHDNHHLKQFTGTPEQLQTLVEWLLQQ